MSLVGQTIAVLVKKMLVSHTWAGTRVMLQPIDPIAAMARDDNGKVTFDGKPCIAVYVENAQSNPVGLEFQSGSTDVTLKVISYIPPVLKITQDEIDYQFDNQGAGLALSLMGQQIERAMHIGGAPWVALFRKFAKETKSVKRRYLLIELESGVRIPAAETTFELCKVIPEPKIGDALYGYWLEFDTALRATEAGEDIKLADLLKTAIEAPEDMPSWRRFREMTNLTEAAWIASGLAPLVTDDEDEQVLLEEVVIDPEVEIVGPGGL